MSVKPGFSGRLLLIVPVALAAVAAGAATRRVQDQCGPFTDVSALFCPYVLEAYYTGITAGTSATTFSPDIPITRGQAAVFVTKGLNQALARGSRRAALGQWWTTQGPDTVASLSLPNVPTFCASDGTDIWVAGGGKVVRVHGSDMTILGTWSGAGEDNGVAVAMGKIFVAGSHPGTSNSIYMIDPSQPPGPVTSVADVGILPKGIAFDGQRLWTTNQSSISIVTPGATTPWSTTTVTTGFSHPVGILYDGSNIWVTDSNPEQLSNVLLKLDSNGAVLQTVNVGGTSGYPVFDGANIWTPSNAGSVTVVQASTGQVLATLPTPGADPLQLAFDGERVLATSWTSLNVNVWRAADLSSVGGFSLINGAGGSLSGVCSDGISFWIGFPGNAQLLKFN